VKRGLRIPTNVKFVSIDFDKESLSEKLEEAGLVRGGRSLFVLEGLVMYLQAESVDETFKVIERIAGEGSEVVFDYVRGPVLRQEGLYYGEREIVKSVAKAGERWNFGIEDEGLEIFLKSYGLILNERKYAQDLEQMYFTNTSGQIMGRVNATHCLVRATKPASSPASATQI
jgi:methyltransferase (TIGR00027 family)